MHCSIRARVESHCGLAAHIPYCGCAQVVYLIIEDTELEAIEIASTHTIEIDSFVPRSEIDQRFFDTPYYITPNEPVGQEAFAVIREAMRGKGLVALGRLVLSKRERVIAVVTGL